MSLSWEQRQGMRFADHFDHHLASSLTPALDHYYASCGRHQTNLGVNFVLWTHCLWKSVNQRLWSNLISFINMQCDSTGVSKKVQEPWTFIIMKLMFSGGFLSVTYFLWWLFVRSFLVLASLAFVGGFLSRRILRKPRASTALYNNPTSRLLWLWFRSNPILSLLFLI